MQDLHDLPKLRDSLSYLYIERAVIERDQFAIKAIDHEGKIQVPATNLCLLMLGPGTSITHAAMKVLAENGCSVLWTGEDGMRLYAQGGGETRKSYHLIRQAELVSDPQKRTAVVLRMYKKRFGEQLSADLSLSQIRGLEGVRVRKAYRQASQEYGVLWRGRIYDPGQWGRADPINRALSAANALLNGICHAAIVSGGYSPALGFIHTGRMQSFTYDVADLYKTEITIPTAFEVIHESEAQIDSRVRAACREKFRQAKLLERILPDIDEILGIDEDKGNIPLGEEIDVDGERMFAAPIWEELVDEPGGMAWS